MEEDNGFRDRLNSSMMEKKLKCNPAAEEKMGKRFFCIEQQVSSWVYIKMVLFLAVT